MKSNVPKYIVCEKRVGQTPLEVIHQLKAASPYLAQLPMAYAGRLDPMASGKLLILIGEECKKQTSYHNLDKEYVFEILFGIHSDTGDVLGIVDAQQKVAPVSTSQLEKILQDSTGPLAIPYPLYSSKTVRGKPLHTWALEGRISEITIPVNTTNIHYISLENVRLIPSHTVFSIVREKIETIPQVTDLKKALGADFRRADVRASWDRIKSQYNDTDCFTVATIRCGCSSGTYMRSLAEYIAKKCTVDGLAFSIHRSKIGKYKRVPFLNGFWTKQYCSDD